MIAPWLALGKRRNTLRLGPGMAANSRLRYLQVVGTATMLLLLLEWTESLGLLPTSENAETSGMASTPNTQKSPESFSEMADPRK